MKTLPHALLVLVFCTAPAFASVTVSSPSNGETVSSPARFVAAASATTCSRGVASIGVYIDNQLKYVANGASLSSTVALAAGDYNAVVQEWDYCGGVSKASLTIKVSPPTAPVAAITVTAPTPGKQVTSPFGLRATGATCEGQPVSSMGYSLDGSAQIAGAVSATTLAAQVTAAAGTHVLHVKSWGPDGAACDTDVAVEVVTSAASVIPATATPTRNIQTFLNWEAQHDTGTNVAGLATSSSGATSMAATPSISGASRLFKTSFLNYGGELYWDDFANDSTSQNWFLDEEIYIASGSTFSNIESDIDQVDASGNTVIMGFQCDHYNHTWDYAYTNSTGVHWAESRQGCDAQKWATNSWHHVQIYFSRDNSGNVTYHSVWLDNVQQDIGVTVPSSLSLGWDKVDGLNFQVDGFGATGSSRVYLDDVTIHRW